MMGRMQQHSCSSLVLFVMVSVAGMVLSVPSSSHRSRVRNQNMKVRITATGDTIVMKFLRPNLDTKLEGYILGYGSSMFSKQFIQLPENGQPYETEFDAEPKYLIAVQPMPTNEVKKQCAGKVELEKPLHLVIGSVTPTSVLLSWGTLLKTPYEGNIMNDCLEDGHYTVRYREKNRRWNYQTCPTSDTVIDNLKPNTVYEFGVQPNSKDGTGTWSKPVIHNISSGGVEEKVIRKIFKRPINLVKPLPGPNSFPFAPRHVFHNRTKGKLPTPRNITPKTTIAPTTTTRQEKLLTPGPTVPVITRQPFGGGDAYRSALPPFREVPLGPKLSSPIQISVPSTHSVTLPQENVENRGGHPVIGTHQKPWSTGYVQTHSQPPWQQLPPKPRPHSQQSDLELLAKIESQPKSPFKLPPQIPPTSQLPPTYQPIPQTQPGSRPMQNVQTIPQIPHKSEPQPRFQHTTLTQPDSQPLAIDHQIIDTQPESQPLSTSDPIIEDLPESWPLPIPYTIIEAQPESQPLPISDPIIEDVPESWPHPIPVTIIEAQPESKPHPISHPIVEAQPESQPFPTSHPISEALPGSQTLSKSLPITNAQPETQPLPISHPMIEPEPQPLPISYPKIDAQSESQPLPIPRPNVEAQPEPQPLPVSDPFTEAQYESQPPPRSYLIPQTQPGTKHLPISKPMKKNHMESQTLPTTQSKPQSSYQPQHKQMNSPIPDILNHPITHVKSKITLQTKSQSQPQPTPPFRPQTTTQLWSQPEPHHHSQPQTTPSSNLAFQPHSTIQRKHPSQTHSEEKHQMKQIQPADLTTAKTPQTTHGSIFQTQQGLPKTHMEPQQNSQSARPQTLSNSKHEIKSPQPQPQQNQHPKPKSDTKRQHKSQIKPKSNTDLFLFQSNTKSNNPSKKQSVSLLKPQPNVRTKVKIHPQPKNQSRHQSEPSNIQIYPLPPFQPTSPSQFPKTGQDKSHPKSLPKPRPASKSQPQLQHGSLFEHQTRNLSDPTKVAPRETVPTAPSPPEEGKPLPRPALATEKAGSYDHGTGILKPSTAEVPRSPINSSATTSARNTTLSRTRVPPHSTRNGGRSVTPPKTFTSSHSSRTPGADGAHHKGNALPKPVVWSKEKPAVLHPSVPVNKRPNLVGKPTGHDKPMDLKQGEQESILKPFPLVTAKPKQERRQQSTTTNAPTLNSISNTTFNGTRFDINQNSSIFRPLPASEVDLMGRMRFVAPHVIYKTDKGPNEPCSITSSLAYFPDEEGNEQNVTGPPRSSPSNLTVVTVEGCPSFVILDWQKSDNETREYEVVSTTKGPNGEEVSVLTTNQTHTAVENLKPESSYEFKVTPKNELGTGPSSDPVSFNTESADPRVSEHASGKDAIWTQFPFKADAYSECNGKQYVKRTWYRKFVGIQLCNSLRYKIYLSDSLSGKFYNIGDQTGYGEDHCQFVDSFLDGRTGTHIFADQLQSRPGFYRAMRQEPVNFGEIGGKSHITYVGWYECGTPIPGKW